MLRPISPRPPMGMMRSVPRSSGAGTMTVSLSVSGMCPPSVAVFSSVRPTGGCLGSRSACGAGDLGQRAAGGGVAVGAEVAEVDARDALHEVDLVLDEGGLPLLGTDERQAHTRARDAAQPVQDVLRRD